ncbi:MAG TPA: Asp-tRNA(Asn)/Glu-tRNA(Gln) amidotransferase subunit GatA [Gaiellaceae bacterium]
MTIDTLRLTAEEANHLLRKKEVSGEELFAAYRAAIDERDPELHCFLRLCDDAGGEGIPIALKDVIGTKGVETTAGSKILAGYVPVYDSTVAARCKECGLRLLGKTNTDEFAMGSSTENSAYGPSRNPWDPTRVPGGSGGGSAAAVSAGLAPWALGSDTGGSVKQPSALCGNVGLRPTYGTVSRYGIVAFASSLDQVGPVAKTVRDCAFLYSVIAGRDPADSTTVDVPEVELPSAEDLKGLRVGVPVEMRDAAGIEPGVRAAVARAVELCRELGATVDECTLPRSVEYGLPCYYLIAPAEASSNLARYDGVRYGLRAATPAGEARGRAAHSLGGAGEGLIEVYERTRSEGFGDEPKRRIMLGTYALSAGYYEAYYGKAQQVRTVIIREHAAVFESFDLIVSATSPTVAFPLGERADDPLAMYTSDLLTIPSCMAGLPGLSIPCGLSEGLPVGLQLIGPQLSENTLFRAGHALERALGFDFVPERLR